MIILIRTITCGHSLIVNKALLRDSKRHAKALASNVSFKTKQSEYLNKQLREWAHE